VNVFLQIQNSKKWEYIAITLIMLVATFMRFYHFADWSLSNDELSALNRLRYDSFSAMLTNGVKLGDFHPAGVQVFLWFWIRIFGNGVWAVRFPFVIFGILSVWMVYLIGKRWFGSSTALFAAASFAFLQYPILYSQLARPYAPGLFFSLAAVWFWTKIVFDHKRPQIDYAGFALSAALAAYTHHYSFLFVIIVGASGFLFYKNLDLKKYILFSLAAGLLYLPHLNIFLYQFGIGGVGGDEGWLGIPESSWILDYLWYAFNESWILIFILSGIFIYSIFSFKAKFSKFHLLALSWFLIMFLVGYLYSIWRNPILQFSILIFSFPFLLLFIFSFQNQKLNKPILIFLLAFSFFGITQTIFINKYYKQQHFGEFKGVAEKIATWNKELGEENISNTIVVNGPFYIHYYLDKMNPGIDFLQYENTGGKDLFDLSHILDSLQTPWFIHAWTKPEPAEIDLLIRNNYPCIVEKFNYGSLSEVTLYAKSINDSCIRLPEPAFTFVRNFDEEDQRPKYGNNLDTSLFLSPPNAFLLDSTTQFAPGYKAITSEINGGNFTRVEVELAAFSFEEIKNTIIVLSIEHEGETYFWRGSQVQNFVFQGKWGKAFLSCQIPKIKNPDDLLKIYVWNPGKSKVFIDNLEVRFYQD